MKRLTESNLSISSICVRIGPLRPRSVNSMQASLVQAADDDSACCDCSILIVGKRSGLGRLRRRPTWLDFNGVRNRQGIFQFNTQVPDGPVHLCMTQ